MKPINLDAATEEKEEATVKVGAESSAKGVVGVCQCGCGKQMPTVTVKGKPMKFIRGHNLKLCPILGLSQHWNWKGGKGTSGKYMSLKTPDHPTADSNGRVLEHRIIAERILGHSLPDNIEIHHINGNGKDNSNKNLVICENKAYHMFLHKRIVAFAECGHANWFKCSFCHKYDLPENLQFKSNSRSHHHRLCYNGYQRIANHKSYHKGRLNHGQDNRP